MVLPARIDLLDDTQVALPTRSRSAQLPRAAPGCRGRLFSFPGSTERATQAASPKGMLDFRPERGQGVRGRHNPDRDSRITFGEVPSFGEEGQRMAPFAGCRTTAWRPSVNRHSMSGSGRHARPFGEKRPDRLSAVCELPGASADHWHRPAQKCACPGLHKPVRPREEP